MRHITVCVSDEIYHHARLCAARRDLSASALVREFFASLTELPSNYYGLDRPDDEPCSPTPIFLG